MKTSAERSRLYRERHKTSNSGKSGKSWSSKPMFDNGEFIAIDGEGESYGEIETTAAGQKGKYYKSRPHKYTLLAASTGESLFDNGERLKTQNCIDWFLDLADEAKRQKIKPIFVIFAGGYDINHIFMGDDFFDRKTLQEISRGFKHSYIHEGVKYEIELRNRKSLTLRRGYRYNPDRKTVSWGTTFILWDVWGFFQDSFVGVLRKWLGENYRHYALIKEMKKLRGDFEHVDQSKINTYNAAELESLVEVMNKVRESIGALDLKIRRWDGAGALAAAILKKQETKNFKRITPVSIIDAVQTAYAGGRIEVCKIGIYKGAVYDYDINSAYPNVMLDLPCLLHGAWIHATSGDPTGFCVVHLKYNFCDGLPFYPLFFRTEQMQISYPRTGEGWYWLPEYLSAVECIKKYGGELEIIEFYRFNPQCDHKPFAWIPEYYDLRQQYIKNPTEEWQYGAEKVIKLGLNSLYGKTAQQLGGSAHSPPPYHQLEWAGYITAATRARLYLLGEKRPASVIGFATDGVFSTEQLLESTDTRKAIGAWELKTPQPVGMTIAMAGVYWWHYADDSFGHFSRGFDKDAMQTPHAVLDAWKKGLSSLEVPLQRLIGMGSACTSDIFWYMRGRFTQGIRELKIDGTSHKRQSINVRKTKPHKGLVDLAPAHNYDDGCSFPYPIVWLQDDDSDFQEMLEETREQQDTENI